jgi:TM2 domain-containing membrane protein YozV
MEPIDKEFGKTMLIEVCLVQQAPSVNVAYVLWLTLGMVSAHRFYMGRVGSGFLQILAWLCFFVPGLIWWLIDGASMRTMIDEERKWHYERIKARVEKL